MANPGDIGGKWEGLSVWACRRLARRDQPTMLRLAQHDTLFYSYKNWFPWL